MPRGEAEMHSFSYTNDQILYNQFSPYFLCRVSWLPIITNLGNLSQNRLNEYQLISISFNYNICGIWKILNNTRQRKYGRNNFLECSFFSEKTTELWQIRVITKLPNTEQSSNFVIHKATKLQWPRGIFFVSKSLTNFITCFIDVISWECSNS